MGSSKAPSSSGVEQLPFHQHDPFTSRIAAELAAPGAKAHRVRLLLWLYRVGDGNAEEAWKATGGKFPHVASTRLLELSGPKHGFLVRKTERTRRTTSGAPAILWELTEAGMQFVENMTKEQAA